MIPRIIHQIWIGLRPAPKEWMQTWRDKNPSFHYILWDEERLSKEFPCVETLDLVQEINGKADIYRWEILSIYGGLFFDADSICVESIPDSWLCLEAFSCYEHETLRPGLIACGAMGFIPKHPIVQSILELIRSVEYRDTLISSRAWYSVGPGILTKVIEAAPSAKGYKISLFPSYTFYPKHHTGKYYRGHGKVFAFQYWCSSYQSYDWTMEEQNRANQELTEVKSPVEFVSIIVPCYEASIEYIAECLESIQQQEGSYAIELVWVNDGSSSENTAGQIRLLKELELTSRNIKVVYLENRENRGCRYTLRKAVEHCTSEFIIKMDADDIMAVDRIETQIQFMRKHPDLALCGGQVVFLEDGKYYGYVTKHPEQMTWDEFVATQPSWFMNHPTFCFRRAALLQVGNYPEMSVSSPHSVENMMDDYEIVIRILKQYKRVMNIPRILVTYRIHPLQMTQVFRNKSRALESYRNQIIHKYVDENELSAVKTEGVYVPSHYVVI